MLRTAYGSERPCCSRCEFVFFRQTATAAAAVVVFERQILLVQRGIGPYRGAWGFPGGFQEHGERPDQTAARETMEEAGVQVGIDRVLDVRHTADDPRKVVNVVIYLARPTSASSVSPVAGDDASDARFFDFRELPDDIAFAANREILADLRQRFPDGDIR